MTNHKYWSTSSALVRQLLEMGDTPRGTTEYWRSWSEQLKRKPLGHPQLRLTTLLTYYMKSEPTILTQIFVSERSRIYAGSKQTIKHLAVPGQNLLESSRDWEVSADLPEWHNDYPKTISSKGLWPDIVLLSRANLKIIMVELSILYISHKYKTSKYEDLKKELEKEGYSVIVKTVEIGARGFVSRHPVIVSKSNQNQRA